MGKKIVKNVVRYVVLFCFYWVVFFLDHRFHFIPKPVAIGGALIAVLFVGVSIYIKILDRKRMHEAAAESAAKERNPKRRKERYDRTLAVLRELRK